MPLLRMPLEDKTTHFALSRPGMIPKLTCLIGIVLIDMVITLPNYTGLAGVTLGANYGLQSKIPVLSKISCKNLRDIGCFGKIEAF